MIEITNKAKCSGCHACQSVCPKNCISMKSNAEGFLYPIVNKELCINCNLCKKICPILNKAEVQNEHVAYAAYNKDENVRMQSSSGGIFTLLAESVINRGGVVFGACFDKEFNVIHNFVSDINGLSKFRGSKYVQSKIGDTYIKAKEFLDKNRLVLFTGTPCQIGGLKSYLQKDYDNLICQDIICHGVPSPLVWQKYVEFQENNVRATASSICFREKAEGWRQYSVSILFKNGTQYKKYHQEDLLMKAFLSDVCLRPSCYDCSFKTLNRQSDITLADFWGIENVVPEMDDNKGTSLIITNNGKGEALLKNINDQIAIKQVGLDCVNKYNHSYRDSAKLTNKRKGFMTNIKLKSFDCLVKKYCTITFIDRVINKVKRVIGGIT
ncbi:MAG: Coenzyme F420 hydrogenase/dehydrogenase, beta subunit C-terminal domain, partial [Oscillospiraceae bacterium]